MKQTTSLQQFTFGFLLAAGLFLLMVLGSSVTAQSDPSSESESALSLSQAASSISTAITYQGSLDDGGNPATGTYDFRFQLHDALSDGVQLGEVFVSNVVVENGRFTVQLDFGANAYAAQATWLEIAVDSGGYQTLTPRQPLTAAPLALNLPNVYTNPTTGQVGIGTDTPFNQYTWLTVQSPNTATWGGIYMSTSGVTGRPFYGYSANGVDGSAWHEYNGSVNEWQLYVGGNTPDISVNRDGDIAQKLTSDGLVKAAVFADCRNAVASIDRSFNNVNNATISINSVANGTCTIDFGFDISERFWSATGIHADFTRDVTCVQSLSSNSKLDCLSRTTSGNPANGDIIVLIY